MHFGVIFPVDGTSMKRYLITRTVIVICYCDICQSKVAQGELEVLSPGLSSGASGIKGQ